MQLACEPDPHCEFNEHVRRDGVRLPASCACDSERPIDALDCEQGETFLCDEAVFDHEGRPFDRKLAFNCRCVANETSCGEVCEVCFDFDAPIGSDSPRWQPFVCLCSLPTLR
jgi:hypothetical protein